MLTKLVNCLQMQNKKKLCFPAIFVRICVYALHTVHVGGVTLCLFVLQKYFTVHTAGSYWVHLSKRSEKSYSMKEGGGEKSRDNVLRSETKVQKIEHLWWGGCSEQSVTKEGEKRWWKKCSKEQGERGRRQKTARIHPELHLTEAIWSLETVLSTAKTGGYETVHQTAYSLQKCNRGTLRCPYFFYLFFLCWLIWSVAGIASFKNESL